MFSGYSQKLVVNFIGFQCFWWACILLQNQALLICLVLLTLHLLFHRQPAIELQSISVIAGIGFFVDSSLTHFGLFHFTTPLFNNGPPVWLLALWFGFATTVTTCCKLITKRWHAMAIGALFAPVSYLASIKLGAASILLPVAQVWITLMFVWLWLMPLLLSVANKIQDNVEYANVKK